MKILVLFIVLISFFIYIALIYVIVKMKSISKFNEIQFLKMLRQLRYGQLQVDLSSFKNENIKIASEKLLVALQDRENMISEYKHILTEKNKSLEKMIEMEKESQKFKDDFVAALNHDLRTPVIAELNAIKMLLNENFGQLSDTQKNVLRMMQKSDEDLIELSELISQTYKFQYSEIKLNKNKVDISVFSQQIFDELKPIFIPKQQTPVAEIALQNKFLEIDEMHFKRVIQNLLMNAAKYGFSNTKVILKVFDDEKNVMIQVINEGETINPNDINLIFNKYYSGIKKFEHLSTGLGLYCANKIVTAHGGNIDVISQNGKTSFTVYVPLNTAY